MARWLFWVIVLVLLVCCVAGTLFYLGRPRVPYVSARELQKAVESSAHPPPKLAIVTILDPKLSPLTFPVLDHYGERHGYDIHAYKTAADNVLRPLQHIFLEMLQQKVESKCRLLRHCRR